MLNVGVRIWYSVAFFYGVSSWVQTRVSVTDKKRQAVANSGRKKRGGKRQDKSEREKAERQLEYSSNKKKKKFIREVSLKEAACTRLQNCLAIYEIQRYRVKKRNDIHLLNRPILSLNTKP